MPSKSRLFVLLAIAVVSIVRSQDANLCPENWTFSNVTHYCYHLSQRAFNFDDAQAYCQSIGGDLASIYSYTERNYIANLTQDMVILPWIGLRRNLTNNVWFNVDGSNFLSWWANGEPNDGGNCAAWRANSNYNSSMNDEVALPCFNTQPALCKQYAAICNGGDVSTMTQSNGNFTSPNYPNHYYNNLDCFYYITGPVDRYLTIYFDPYLVEKTFDYIRVYEGRGNSSANLIGEIRYDSDELSFESLGNVMTVWFHTDASVVKNGWMAIWNSVSRAPAINQTGSQGELSSPNYPNNYNSFTEQYYYVVGTEGFQVRLNIDVFDTETTHDYLDIFNSTDVFDNSTRVARLSGWTNVAPWSYTFPTNKFGMLFVSDWLINYKGWHGTWSIVAN